MTDKLKKVVMGVAALAALALGGAALAGATSGGKDDAQQQRSEPAEQNEASEREEPGGGADRDDVHEERDSDEPVTGEDASRAKQAAAAHTGGRPGEIERDGEKGAAYEVEITKSDGKQADVRLDDRFKVVAVDEDDEQDESGEQDEAEDQDESGEQDEAGEQERGTKAP